MRAKIINNFDYPNVVYAQSEIEKFKLVQYDSLEYPVFKTSIIENRIKENSKLK